ncbi:hypothetical protein [Enterobacter hormaechei]|uniref:hypothetical protein n=1 Tax=Enterobacter hormaechei TaxID=158836 RepID=UPI002162DB5F|nr:hypothetical protein [Enterobacter hormaechei]MCS0522641.1 hypothetical protein [Enterobacter hormaechei]
MKKVNEPISSYQEFQLSWACRVAGRFFARYFPELSYELITDAKAETHIIGPV